MTNKNRSTDRIERKHETLTANISKPGFEGKFKIITFTQSTNGLISRWHGSPGLLILANRYQQSENQGKKIKHLLNKKLSNRIVKRQDYFCFLNTIHT